MKKILFFAVLIGSFLIINNLVRSIADLWHKQDLIEQAKIDVEKEKKDNQKIKEQLSKAQSEQFVEEQARNKLFLVKPDEKFALIPQNLLNTASPSASMPPLPNWQQWLKLFF